MLSLKIVGPHAPILAKLRAEIYSRQQKHCIQGNTPDTIPNVANHERVAVNMSEELRRNNVSVFIHDGEVFQSKVFFPHLAESELVKSRRNVPHDVPVDEVAQTK